VRTLLNLWTKNKKFFAFLLLMAFFRSAVADWNIVPSGSMLPTIRIGDRILVDKMAYDLRVPFTHIEVTHLADPQRGDIVTIDSSSAHELLVKRVVGVPGDVITMNNNVLYINGSRVGYHPLGANPPSSDRAARGEYVVERFGQAAHIVRLSLDAPSQVSSFGPVTVPPGKYLMLGDNRDDSADSRYFGFFPRNEIMGRTTRVAYSLDPTRFYLPRFDRFGSRLDALLD
jgi:signal peptidase I